MGLIKNLQTPQNQDWDRFWGRDESQQFSRISWSKQRILDQLLPYCQSGHAALDAGCGSGFFARFFCSQNMRVTALDYSQNALQMARSATNGGAKLIQADMVSDVLSTKVQETFDLIFTDGLFEHFVDLQQDAIMKNLISVLKPGGVVVTFVPNRWSPWELIRPLYMPGIDEKPFVLSQLKDLNVRNGLNLVKAGGVNVLPFRVSPEVPLGAVFGMLLFTIAVKV